MLHHRQRGIVELFVLVVEEDQLSPQVGVFGCSQHFRDVHATPEQLQMLAHLLRLVLTVQNRQLGEHAHMSSFQSQSRFEKP